MQARLPHATGTGKSTLLKILCGLESLDYGEVTFAKRISQGYLPRDGLSLTERTVLPRSEFLLEHGFLDAIVKHS
jgi:ATPase subunit of ABC transporter with duplicated ATPase domains